MAAGVYAAEICAVWVFSGQVEQIDASEDREEAAEERDGIYGVGGIEAAKQDEGGYKGAGREGHVVERVDAGRFVSTIMKKKRLWDAGLHVGRKLAESFVEVIHLAHDADYHDDSEDVGTRTRELVISCKGHLDRDAEALDRHDGDAADGRADG